MQSSHGLKWQQKDCADCMQTLQCLSSGSGCAASIVLLRQSYGEWSHQAVSSVSSPLEASEEAPRRLEQPHWHLRGRHFRFSSRLFTMLPLGQACVASCCQTGKRVSLPDQEISLHEAHLGNLCTLICKLLIQLDDLQHRPGSIS